MENGESQNLGYTFEQKEELVREYLGPEREARCPVCAEELEFEFEYSTKADPVSVKVNCPGCANGFTWSPSRSISEWDPLHLEYFEERFSEGAEIRCPYDDCYVGYYEFPGSAIQFRCPFCNRRGTVSLASEFDASKGPLDTPMRLKV